MIPQDSRAPQRNQRWVEAANVSSEDIPAYAVVEVIESTRPESGNALTPSGGRTVASVRKPTAGLTYPIMVNGLLAISGTDPEFHGKVTNDYPTYVLYDDTNAPQAGEEWGPQAGSYKIHKGGKGFIILGDADATWGIVRVLHCCASNLIFFKMTSQLPLGGKGTAIEIKSGPGYEEVGEEFPIKDPHTDPGTWREDVHVLLRPVVGGYRGWCLIPPFPEFDENGEPYREIVHMEQIARSINFTLVTALSGGSATVTLDNYYLGKDPSDVWPGNEGMVLKVYDPQGQFPLGLVGCKGKARYNDRDHQYEVVVCNQMADKYMCVATGAMCLTDGSVGITGHSKMSWQPHGADASPLPSYALNLLPLACMQGDVLIIDYSYTLSQWVVTAVGLHAQDVGDGGLYYEACALINTTVPIAVARCSVDITENMLLMNTHSYMQSFTFDSATCSLVAQVGTFCAFDVAALSSSTQVQMYLREMGTGTYRKTVTMGGSGDTEVIACKIEELLTYVCLFDAAEAEEDQIWGTVVTATEVELVQDVYDNATCVVKVPHTVWVICDGTDQAEGDVFCPIDCP